MSRYVPPQHGAWAFLGLPLVLGLVVAPWTPVLILLAVAWVAAYPLSYAALGMARAKRKDRFRRPLAVWAAIVVPAVALLLVARPWLIWVGLAYAVLFAVNVRYAKANDERALANDLVFIAECAGMVAVTWMVGAGDRSWSPPWPPPAHVWALVVICALALTGSTLHVKSLMRERRDPRYATASRVYAVVAVLAAAAVGWWWGLPAGWWFPVAFAPIAVRAFVVGRRPLRPAAVGMIELGGFVLVAAAAVLAAR